MFYLHTKKQVDSYLKQGLVFSVFYKRKVIISNSSRAAGLTKSPHIKHVLNAEFPWSDRSPVVGGGVRQRRRAGADAPARQRRHPVGAHWGQLRLQHRGGARVRTHQPRRGDRPGARGRHLRAAAPRRARRPRAHHRLQRAPRGRRAARPRIPLHRRRQVDSPSMSRIPYALRLNYCTRCRFPS